MIARIYVWLYNLLSPDCYVKVHVDDIKRMRVIVEQLRVGLEASAERSWTSKRVAALARTRCRQIDAFLDVYAGLPTDTELDEGVA